MGRCINASLLHCDGFCQISWLVYIISPQNPEIICKKLQRYYRKQRREHFKGLGYSYHVIRYFADARVSGRCNRDDRAPACFDLLHVGKHFFVHRVLRRDADGRDVFVYHRNRTVFELSCRIPLGMDIRDFFELERAFQRHWQIIFSAEEEEMLAFLVFVRKYAYGFMIMKPYAYEVG